MSSLSKPRVLRLQALSFNGHVKKPCLVVVGLFLFHTKVMSKPLGHLGPILTLYKMALMFPCKNTPNQLVIRTTYFSGYSCKNPCERTVERTCVGLVPERSPSGHCCRNLMSYCPLSFCSTRWTLPVTSTTTEQHYVGPHRDL